MYSEQKSESWFFFKYILRRKQIHFSSPIDPHYLLCSNFEKLSLPLYEERGNMQSCFPNFVIKFPKHVQYFARKFSKSSKTMRKIAIFKICWLSELYTQTFYTNRKTSTSYKYQHVYFEFILKNVKLLRRKR